MFKKSFIFAVLLVLFFSESAEAIGRGPGARPAAMGGAYSAIAQGIEAFCWNPAGMASPSPFSFMLSGGGSSTLTFQQATDLFNQLKTSQGRSQYVQDNILNEIKIIGIAQIPLGVSFGNFGIAAVGWGDVLANKAELDFDFILLGDYQLDYGIIYGDSFGSLYAPLEDLYWGITLKGYLGEARMLYYTPNIVLIDNQLKTVAVEGGGVLSNGVGGDIGLKYVYDNKFTMALAVKDIASAYDQKLNFNYREVDFNNKNLGGIVATLESSTHEISKSRWTLGLAYNLEELGFLISSDVDHYNTVSVLPSDPQFGNEVEVTDIHLGIEKIIYDWLFLRAGASSENLGGIAETWLTYGLGVKAGELRIDLAAGNSSQKTWQIYLESGLSL